MSELLEYTNNIAAESANELHVQSEMIAILESGYETEIDNTID